MDELIYRVALSMLPLKPHDQRRLLDATGSATEVYHHHRCIKEILPECGAELPKALAGMEAAIVRARREVEFAEQKNIRILTIGSAEYPRRMAEADDAPTVLYQLGPADLNAKHIVSIVGTRHCTTYGVDLCNQFVDDLKELVPDVVVFSGLAYGIDVCAHRRCLADGVTTVGVLAHGLDMIYPTAHRRDASAMAVSGGLLTEFPSGTEIQKPYFLSRNRIIAGCADATLVVESREKGGSLHTARMAQDYNRDVYTFPARVTDINSRGCLDLIYNNVARPICSAQQFVEAQCWEISEQSEQAVQTELFAEMDDTKRLIVGRMRDDGADQFTVDRLVALTTLPIHVLKVKLMELEMDSLIAFAPGGTYRLSNACKTR